MQNKRVINVVMYGARRAGKSSTLASMIDNFSDIRDHTAFRLSAINKTRKHIEDKQLELRGIYQNQEYINAKRFPMDDNPTSKDDTYEFSLELQQKRKLKKITNLIFHDVRGEAFIQHDPKTTRLLQNADVIIVAIDTVYLMEVEPAISQVFNNVGTLINLLQKSGFGENGPKLLLFAPLKCEKYYYQNRMDEVTEKIEDSYGKLIDYLKIGTKKDRITIAVTPILTMGTIVFDDFKRDENDNICLIRNSNEKGLSNRPEVTYYKFYEKPCYFSPKYCEQPILYILAFVGNMVKKNTKNNGLNTSIKILLTAVSACFNLVVTLIGVWFLRNKIFSKSYDIAIKGLKKSGDGYKIIQNPYDI